MRQRAQQHADTVRRSAAIESPDTPSEHRLSEK
jgi:hypothetical protein